MTSDVSMDRAELAQILRFFAEAGLDFPIEAEPSDRFSQPPAPDRAERADASAMPTAAPQKAPPGPPASQAPAAPHVVPDEQAVALAQAAAASAVDLDALKAAVEAFDGCNLKRSARHTIFEAGNRSAGVMVVGAAPSRDDDRTGEAMSGLDGILLTNMLAAIGLDRQTDVYCGFCVPWAVPGGEPPAPLALKICAPLLERQIALAGPRLLVTLGNTATQHLMDTRQPITRARGQWIERVFGGHPCAVTALFEPALLREQPRLKRLAWFDLLAIGKRLNEGAPLR